MMRGGHVIGEDHVTSGDQWINITGLYVRNANQIDSCMVVRAKENASKIGK